MNNRHELAGIDLVWWPTLLRCEYQAQPRQDLQFTECLARLAKALASQED